MKLHRPVQHYNRTQGKRITGILWWRSGRLRKPYIVESGSNPHWVLGLVAAGFRSRGIGKVAGMKSSSSVQYHLKKLTELGLLIYAPGQMPAYYVSDRGRQVLEFLKEGG